MSDDRKRNTFQYNNVDIIVESDIESVSGISFLIRDTSLPGQAYFSFAYFDDTKRFIDCGCDWDKMLK
jgi:hypothetical protein